MVDAHIPPISGLKLRGLYTKAQEQTCTKCQSWALGLYTSFAQDQCSFYLINVFETPVSIVLGKEILAGALVALSVQLYLFCLKALKTSFQNCCVDIALSACNFNLHFQLLPGYDLFPS